MADCRVRSLELDSKRHFDGQTISREQFSAWVHGCCIFECISAKKPMKMSKTEYTPDNLAIQTT